MPVNTQHDDYIFYAPDIKKCRDAAFGRKMVHGAGDLYLPILTHSNPTTQAANYKAYKQRAGFYNATSRTLDAWSGMIFRKDPIEDWPTTMEAIIDDVTLGGMPFRSLAEKATSEVLEASRFGVLVDYPQGVEGQLTQAEAESMNRRPHACAYLEENIINWRYSRINNKMQLTFLVLSETVEESDPADEFETILTEQYRVLDFDEGGYRQRIYQMVDGKQIQIGDDILPTMNNNRLDFIPFEIFTADCDPMRFCKPPILDLAEINLAHYRNMADLEHGAHYTAIPTPTISGMRADDLEKDDCGDPIPLTLGSGEAVFIPDPQGRAAYLEFTGAGLKTLRELSEDKKAEMATLGARMIAPEKRAAETAETHAIKRQGENATLATIAKSISSSLENVLEWLRDWSGATGEVSYQLNTDFMPADITPQSLLALLQAVQSGQISGDTFWWNLQRGEVADSSRSWEDEKEMIESDPEPLSIQ